MRSKSDEINVAQAQKFAGLLSDPLNPKIGLFFLAIVPPRSAGLPSWFGPRAGPAAGSVVHAYAELSIAWSAPCLSGSVRRSRRRRCPRDGQLTPDST